MSNSIVIYVGNGHVRNITCLNCGAVNNEVKCGHCGWEPHGALPEKHVEYQVHYKPTSDNYINHNEVDDVIGILDYDDDVLPF